MSEYGQLIPALPQIYWNQNIQQFTKTGLTGHMCRALKTVGMVPLAKFWPYDALDPANAEIVLAQGVNATSTYVFPFDFPDSSTFSVDNVLYRPFIAVVAYYGNLSTATTSNQCNDYFRVECGVRLDGATSMNDTRGRWRQFTSAHYGWGNQGDAVVNNGSGGVGDLSRGCSLFKPDWKPWASGAFVDNDLLSVKNFFVYLGSAGLFVYLGAGITKDLFGSVMAAGFGFGGARLPGRAATPDANIGRINPIVHMPLLETNSAIWNSGTARLRTLMQSMQHDLVGTQNLVYADLWNLENSEIPFYADGRPNTVPSPRALSSGQGAHILGRVVVIPKAQFSASSILMGPVNSRIVTNDTRPLFSEVFACPRLRFADLTAPMGDYQDPDTLDNWRIVPHPAVGCKLALYSENAVTFSTLTVGNKTLVATYLYDLTSTTQTGTGAFPVGSPVTVSSTPSGANASVVHLTIPGGAATARWTSPASTDLLTVDMTPFTGTATLDLTWTITPSPADSADSTYEVVLDVRIRGGAEDAHGMTLAQAINGTMTAIGLSDGITSRTEIFTAGANTGHYAYDYKTYSAGVVRDVSQTGSPILLRFRADRTANNTDATVIEVKSIRINRYRYI